MEPRSPALQEDFFTIEQTRKPTDLFENGQVSLVQFSLVAQSCLTLCDPMDCSMPGLPLHHQLPEFTQTHVH